MEARRRRAEERESMERRRSAEEEREIVEAMQLVRNKTSMQAALGKRTQAALGDVVSLARPVTDFAQDSVHFLRRCHRPDRREFRMVACRTAVGMVLVGFVGFFVKLISIPLNNIILASP